MIILIIIIIILVLTTWLQYHKRKVIAKELNYIENKLINIIENRTSENILLITEDKDLQKLLIQINNLLVEKNAAIITYRKKESTIKKMISNMSHDLKTPLTVMLGTTEILIHNENLSIREQMDLLKKVYSKVVETSYLIDKFFDLSKLEAGDFELPLSKINLNSVCQNSILFFYETITSKGLVVKIDIPQTPIYSLLNEDALNRILGNLINNAISYGSDGNVIGLSLEEDNENVIIEVWDAGKGINEKYHELIFERLYTLEDSRNRLYQGSGLGLTITKKLVEKLQGTINVQSTPYEKTVFTLTFKKSF